jgi:endogenous inhibitor of DNA gyrase (YacG/DUF329 family)
VNPGWKVSDNSVSGTVINAQPSTSKQSTSKAVPSTELDAPAEAVRAQVRNFWTNRFSGQDSCSTALMNTKSHSKIESSSTTTNGCEVIDLKDDDDNKTKCPVCSKLIESSAMNAHLDKCLEESPATIAETSKNPFVEEDCITLEGDSYPCPVCSKPVLSEQMNEHLDTCVQD